MTPVPPAQPPAAPETEWRCPTCHLIREEPDEAIQPGDYYTVDPTSPRRCPSCGCVPGRDTEAAARVAWAREHRTVIRSHGCDSPAPECFCGSPMTPHRFPEPESPPAAPETDVSALRESLAAATPGPWEHGHEGLQGGEVIRSAQTRIARVYKSNWPDYKPDCENAALIVAAVNALPALLADLEAARERLRVVEGERDAARAEERMRAEDHARAWRQVEAHERRRTEIEDILDEVLGTEEDDGAGEGLVADVQLAVDRLAARAESAEAAHEALRKGVEALLADGPDGWEGYESRDTGHVFLADSVTDWTADLRALLAGGEER